jgi:hypothetical protein
METRLRGLGIPAISARRVSPSITPTTLISFMHCAETIVEARNIKNAITICFIFWIPFDLNECSFHIADDEISEHLLYHEAVSWIGVPAITEETQKPANCSLPYIAIIELRTRPSLDDSDRLRLNDDVTIHRGLL